MTRYGYARYPSDGDDDGSEQRTLKADGAGLVYTDHAGAGTTAERRALAACLGVLSRGDRLTVTSLAAFALTARPLTVLLADLAGRGVLVCELAGPSTGPASGRLLAAILAAGEAVDAERRGLGTGRRAPGAGRKPKLSPRQQENVKAAWAGGKGESVPSIAARYKVSPNTIYRVLGMMPTR